MLRDMLVGQAEALAHHEVIVPHEPAPAEQHLTKLNVEQQVAYN
jgi:hypothetical protein